MRAYPLVRGKIIRAVGILPVDHDALAVLYGDASDVGAHGRLMVGRAVADASEGRVDHQSLHGGNEFLGIGGTSLADRRRCGHHYAVADDRSLPRIILVLGSVGVEKPLVLGRADGRPWIASDVPADGCLVLERVQIFGLAPQ